MLVLLDARTYVNDLPTVYPPTSAASPESIGQGDGTTTRFYLGFPNVQDGSLTLYIGQVQTVGTQQGIVWTGVDPACYTQNGQQVDFQPYSGTAVGAVAAAGLQTVQLSSVAGLFIGEALDYDGEIITVAAINIGATTISAVFADTHLIDVDVTGTGAPAAGALCSARYLATVMSDSQLSAIMSRNQARYGDDQTSLKGIMNDWVDFLVTNPNNFKITRYDDYQVDARSVIQQMDKLKAQLLIELEGSPRPGRAIPGFIWEPGPNRNRIWSPRR